jgi:DNA-binding LacI/PurR family transcriptional regulator
MPAFVGAGTLASEQGFFEAVGHLGQTAGGRAFVVRHNGSASDLAAKLDVVFDSPRPPSALLVARPEHVFFVLNYLQKRNLAVPSEVSIIARDQDGIFASLNPPIAHYFFDGDMFSRRLTRLVFQLVTRGFLPPKSHLIFPRFFVGRSVKDVTAGPPHRS